MAIKPADPRYDYSKLKDTMPSDEDLKRLKGMLVKSTEGTFWARVLTLVTILAYGILMWICKTKADLQFMIEKQIYEQKRASGNTDDLDQDDLDGQPRP